MYFDSFSIIPHLFGLIHSYEKGHIKIQLCYNVYFVEQVKQYLQNKDQIVDLTALKEIYTIKDNNGNQTRIAGITNCPNQLMNYLEEIFSQKEIEHLYSHTYNEKYELNDPQNLNILQQTLHYSLINNP